MNKNPRLVIVSGRPGSGKTTLAKELGRLIYFPVISRDEIKEGYVSTFQVKHDELPEESNKIASKIFFDTISFLLKNKVSIIVETAFQHKIWKSRFAKLNKLATIYIVVCDAGVEMSAKRHLKRGLDNPMRIFFHGDRRVVHYKKTGEILIGNDEYEPPRFDVPTIIVSTKKGYSIQPKKIGKWILSDRK